MGKYDPTKSTGDDYAKKAKQKFGRPDPLEEIDDETLAEDLPQRPGRESQQPMRDRGQTRGQQQATQDDVESETRWDT